MFHCASSCLLADCLNIIAVIQLVIQRRSLIAGQASYGYQTGCGHGCHSSSCRPSDGTSASKYLAHLAPVAWERMTRMVMAFALLLLRWKYGYCRYWPAYAGTL